MPIEAKHLRDLYNLAQMLRKRDAIVRAAHQAGMSKSEIADITGLGRNTVDRIVAKPAADEGQGDEDQDDERDPEPSGLIRETDDEHV